MQLLKFLQIYSIHKNYTIQIKKYLNFLYIFIFPSKFDIEKLSDTQLIFNLRLIGNLNIDVKHKMLQQTFFFSVSFQSFKDFQNKSRNL